MSSAFTCARLEITNGPRPDHVHYLAHWVNMGADHQAIFAFASKAQAATDYPFGLQSEASRAAPDRPRTVRVDAAALER